jgi:thiol-disulfide isomerase/thioredoxin
VPCRREAPYLSKLHEAYSKQGFAVIAVNAYDEERPLVAEFVKKEKLKQIILLKGSEVASDLYGVPSFPTTYWIDREGRVVRRETGFDPLMFPAMERLARKLVAEKPGPAGR